MKIVLIGLKNNNLGDRIIKETCEYIVKNIYQDAEITFMRLFPDKELCEPFNVKYSYDLTKKEQIKEFLRWYIHSFWKTKIHKYYHKNLKRADKVIFVGGGIIKHSREQFWNPIFKIIDYCSLKRIPVYFNAVGIEGYDRNNFFSNVLEYSLNRYFVKKITTRDDIETLKKYVKNKKKITLVGDPALYTHECYKIEKNKNSEIIGIGVIRDKIYTDYGFETKPDEVVNLYVNLIKELENKNYKWQMFCNGIIADYRTAIQILERLNLPQDEKYLALRPKSSIELLNIISQYKAIVAGRLHANIIATSLNIPSVGIVWNDKLKMFGELIGNPERFIEPKDFANIPYIVSTLENAIDKGYDLNKIEELKKLTKNELTNFITE